MITVPTTRVWRKSSYSGTGNGDCVEVALDTRNVAIRDSKAPATGHLTPGAPAWSALLTKLGRG